MSEELKSALVAGAVALFVALVTGILTVLSNRKTMRQLQHESKRVGITEKRMDWITEVRKLFAELFTYDFIEFYTKQEKYMQFNKTIQLIDIYLNFSGNIDKEILNLTYQLHKTVYIATHLPADRIPNYVDLRGEYERLIEELQKNIRVYLKSEWNRVKFDSDPENYGKKFDEEKEIARLFKTYDETAVYIEQQPIRDAKNVYEQVLGMIQEEK